MPRKIICPRRSVKIRSDRQRYLALMQSEVLEPLPSRYFSVVLHVSVLKNSKLHFILVFDGSPNVESSGLGAIDA